MVPGFPNLFTITGPGSPGVVTNVPVAIEQHVEWVADCWATCASTATTRSRRRPEAADEWTAHVQDVANATLYPTADSWYMGANIPGKPRVFLPYIGGLGRVPAQVRRDRGGRLPGRRRPPAGADAPSRRRLAMALDEATAALLAPSPPATLQEPGVPVARAAPAAQGAATGQDPARTGHRQGRGPVRGGSIPVRVFVPERLAARRHRLYHAGGWVLGGVDECEADTVALAARTGCAVVCPWLPARAGVPVPDRGAGRLGGAALGGGEHRPRSRATAGPPLPLIVAGDSAGGNLAAVVARRSVERGGPDVAAAGTHLPGHRQRHRQPVLHRPR